MSQDFMDPELFADFIVEAKEHLETIEPNLLELEKNPDNLGLLNEIFRPMHSLKGASGFLGLNHINGLAHRAENILDELRKGKIAVTSGIMDVILAATDALRTMIDNLETVGYEGEVETAHIIARIDSILAGEAEPESPAAPGDGTQVEDAPQQEEAAVAEDAPESTPAPDDGEAGGQGRGFIMPELVETGPPYSLQAIGEGHLNDFLEEAQEIIASLNDSLLELEKDPTAGGELVNDIFRFFHNLKGNSGIIGHKELNALTHEAETLLNKVRKGEMVPTRGMIDLLLGSVDMMESLVTRIDAKHNQAIPVDIDFLVEKLQEAVATGDVDLGPAPAPEAAAEAAAPEPAAVEPAAPSGGEGGQASGFDDEDSEIFEETVTQQLANIHMALDELAKDGTNKEYIDGLYRSLDTLRNSASYMDFADIKVYAERTAGMVDQARKAGLDFEMMVDILRQECSILEDMLKKTISSLVKAPAAAEPESAPKSGPAAEPVPEVKVKAEEPKPEAKPAAPEPLKEAPKPVAETAAPKPAAKKAPEPAATKAEEPAPKPKQEPKPAPAKAAEPAPKAAPAPASQAPAAQAQAQAQGGAKVSSTIRVDHEKLDHLMNLIGELIINRNRYALLARSLEEGKLDVQAIAQQLTETTYAMARLSDDLQDTIMKVRMVPVSSVFARFPRLVRDLSRKSGKEVELIMEGEETELDKSVVEVIGDPLVHLIRNSVDHGLETEETRRATGKSPAGKVWLRAYHRGNSVAIEVEDDGKGIDPAKMREVAVRKNLISPDEAKNLDDRDALELIFMPGFSSAETITDISGRGVGMDVVRTNIKNLKGAVSVSSEIGKGTKFTMTLPLTLAIIDALMVMVGNQTYAIPLDAVSETTKIEVRRMTEVNKRKAVTLRGEVLGIIELREVLEIPPDGDDEKEIVSMVILQDNDRRLGVIVDRLLERQEVVIKPLGAYLSDFDMRGLSGATIMGDGSVVLILDPHEIYLMATSQRGASSI
ncbi:chemotaxis protein CheA [Fundidesulfovibrio agrisoli]|uniref:chemotaxis protein CheA n=1 Tax=Fundidesulfovibrio agrisoli TaxID=2922717 RepID=UPI001FAD90B2|nr:chemotaxis protein CheA [Fundidesulfovibrio agrisoli]